MGSDPLIVFVLLDAIGRKQLKRKDIAQRYSIRYSIALKSNTEIDWPRINKAIIKRWSMSGLRYIKDMAWKMRNS